MVNQSSLNELALFAGAGGGILGGKLLGWRTVCAVEWEPYAACVLAARQNDGLLPPFPIWDDVQTFDGKPWRGIVDVVSGGFPCQDISAAGKGDGLDGKRSGMWKHMARVVSEVRPRYVFVENSPMLTTRGGTRVVGDLAALGYDCKWTVMGAADVGANHQRDRMWIVAKWRGHLSHAQHDRIGRWEQQQKGFKKEVGNVAHSKSFRDRRELRRLHKPNEAQRESEKCWKDETTKFDNGCKNVGQPQCARFERQWFQPGQQEIPESWHASSLADTTDKGDVWRQWVMGFAEQEHDSGRSQTNGRREWWQAEPNVGRVVDGVAARVDRLKAIGNGQVPLCAATAWKLLNA